MSRVIKFRAWNRDGFSAKDKDSNDWKIDYDDEVIGNIYEHKHLLDNS